MAAVAATADMTIQKNSQILVNVEEALADLIVVSYCADDKKFQGVLLDSNKGNLPFGVYNLHPAFTKQATPADNSDDKLHSVSQRFLYEDPDYKAENTQKSKKPAPKTKPQQRQKMTVRLRPRKVLCSNCKGICNENNENVDVSKKRKLGSDDEAPQESDSSRLQKKYLMGSMLIPKLSRLQPSEISSAIKGATKNSSKASEKPIKSLKSSYSEDAAPELTFVGVPDSEIDDENKNDQDASFNSMFSSARTLKICFGEGEGTVVKIPPLSGDFNEDSGVSCDMNKTPTKPESKAAKKALKKARKQAKKNSALDKKITSQSPKRIGALSPRNNQSDTTTYILEKRHKHKVKHKKKYRSDKKRDENTTKGVDSESIDYFNNIKKHCLNQKVSISLRRLSSNSCEHQSENEVIESGSDEWEGEMVPEFPENSYEGVGGRLLTVSPGDIVWGKVGGFPWWPGRVLSVTSSSRAHVAWFASKTSSLMSCDSLSHFLADYNIRFNKKKRGPYKEAVKQATIEARQNESRADCDPLGSPTQDDDASVILGSPAHMLSPHPIDVFS